MELEWSDDCLMMLTVATEINSEHNHILTHNLFKAAKFLYVLFMVEKWTNKNLRSGSSASTSSAGDHVSPHTSALCVVHKFWPMIIFLANPFIFYSVSTPSPDHLVLQHGHQIIISLSWYG